MCTNDVISEAGRTHLAWALTDGVGPILFSRLLIHFGDAQTALGRSATELEKVHGIGRVKADTVARTRDQAGIGEEIEAAAAHGVRIICRADPDYPPGLKEIPDAPIVLYLKGELRDTDAVALAIVGTRRCSIYAGEQARRFGELLAGAGFTVVSGLARGCDAFAHHGAVDSGGRSIAVLGNNLSEIYPPENRALAEKLLGNGALVSELPMQADRAPGELPQPQPHYRRHDARHAARGGSAAQRCTDHRASGERLQPRGLRDPRPPPGADGRRHQWVHS